MQGNATRDTADKLRLIDLQISEGKFVDAREELSRLAPAMDQRSDSTTRGEYLYLQAALDFHHRPPREVLAIAKQAYSLVNQTAENLVIGKIQALLGKIYVSLGDLRAGEAYIRDAISSFRRIDAEQELVGCYNKLAQVYFIRGEFKLADKFLTESIQLIERLGCESEVSLFRARGNRARIQTLLGEWESARSALVECVDFARRTNAIPSLAKNLLSLGYVLYLLEQYADSRKALEQAFDLIKAHNLLRERAIYHEYMGELLTALGDTRMARQHYGYAVEIGNRIAPESAIISQTERRIAELEYEAGNLALAGDHARRALEVAEQVGEVVEVAGASKVLGALVAAEGDFEAAVETFDRSVMILETAGELRELAAVYFRAGQALSKSEKHRKLAARYLNSGLRLAEQLPVSNLRIACIYQMAVLEVEACHYDEALQYLQRCEAIAHQNSDERSLEECRILRLNIEDDMVEAGLSNDNEYSLFSSFLSRLEYGSLKSGSLADTLRVLARKINADRAFVFSFDPQSHLFETLASVEFEQAELFRICKTLSNGRGGSLPTDRPLLVTTLGTDRQRMFEYLSPRDQKIGTLLSIPIQLSAQTAGLLYLDRVGENAPPFSKANLDFAIAFSDIIAFKSSEEQKQRLVADNQRLKDQLERQLAFPNIVTANPDLLDILERVRQVKDSSISILLEGETGTGKDMLAKAIHYNSNRKDRRFVNVNCAALPETLMESELFGYKRGAFTGAEGEKIGLFEEADGGTFYLDEIGDMPLSIQVKLLRVIEEKEIVRLGETTPRKVDVRIISATNADLRALMEQGQFRQDLYYRLSTFSVKLPPLRERKEDVPILIKHFVQKTDPEVKIEPEAFSLLADYLWPGNIRELENEIKKLVLLAGEKKVVSSYLLSRRVTEGSTNGASDHEQNATGDGDFSLYEYLGRLERELILKALRKAQWVKKHAAESLSIPESTLRLKMKQYHITPE